MIIVRWAEQLKELTHGERLTREDISKIIHQLELPDEVRRRLLELTPAAYTGSAAKLAREI